MLSRYTAKVLIMGIDLYWEDENGNELGEVADSKSLLSDLISSQEFRNTICIRFIDPYGDTIFNQIQIPFLITELKSIKFELESDDIKNQIDRILELANRADGETHTYLKFYGE